MGKANVLFVDDELNILSAIRRSVIDEPYQAFFAASGQEALAIMGEQEIAVIITDMRMPEMDGLQLLKRVKEQYPYTVRMVLSGYTQIAQVLATVNQADIFSFITKPWDDELSHIIHKAIDYYQLKQSELSLRATLEQRNSAYKNVMSRMQEKIKDREWCLQRISQVCQQLQEQAQEQQIPESLSQLLALLNFYATDYGSIEFELNELSTVIEKALTPHLAKPVEYKVWPQQTASKLNGKFHLVDFVFSTLFQQQDVPHLLHAQIEAIAQADNSVTVKVILLTDQFLPAWNNRLHSIRNLLEAEMFFQLEVLEKKETQIVQLSFAFEKKLQRINSNIFV